MSPRWPSFSMSSCRMICMAFLFAPVTNSAGGGVGRLKPAATLAFAAMAVLRLEIASCFHLKSGSKTPAFQKLRSWALRLAPALGLPGPELHAARWPASRVQARRQQLHRVRLLGAGL